MSRTIKEIVSGCGGARCLAQALGVTVQTIYKWAESGQAIPNKYWDRLIGIDRTLTLNTLHKAR